MGKMKKRVGGGGKREDEGFMEQRSDQIIPGGVTRREKPRLASFWGGPTEGRKVENQRVTQP